MFNSKRLFGLIVLAIVFTFSIPLCTFANQTDEGRKDARNFVQNFYDWYCKTTPQGESEALPDRALSQRSGAFSSSILRKLKDDADASANVSDEIVGLDFDPYLNCQDCYEKYVSGKVTPKGSGYLVEMHGVRKGKKSEKPDVVPEVVKKGKKWIFINFHYPGASLKVNNNLVSVLDALKKSRNESH